LRSRARAQQKKSGFDLILVQKVQQSPDPYATTVFEEGFVKQVSLGGRDGGRNLAVGLVEGISVQRVAFRAFFIVDY
jgi:hypothetical protein